MMRLVTLLLLAPFALAGPVGAQGMHHDSGAATAGGMKVENAWARASAGPASTGAAYFTLVNAGQDDDELVAASTEVARKAGLHINIMEGNVMRMRPIEEIEVPAGETVVLKPGGLHVMLMGLKHPLKQGTRFPLTLTFAKAGSVTVEVAVGSVGASHGGMGAGDGGMHMDHGAMPMGGK